MMQKNIRLSLLIIAVSILTLLSCSKETEEAPDSGSDYFPVENGQYVKYQVESIIWDDNAQTVDTFYYQLQTIIDTQFVDNEGRVSYRWTQLKKTDTTQWAYVHTYAITKTESRLETVEGNNRYVRMAFPVRLSAIWNVNAFNTLDKLNAKYIDVDASKSIGGKMFDKCAIAILEDNSSLINEYYQEDIYARGIGLISRIDKHIDKKITGEIVKGYKNVYTIYESGIISY
jgi:hypothetical protein